jgi:glycosyltransferase involved in cell wall biosynthesis
MLRVEGAIDLDRFDPRRVREDVRPALGVRDGEFLVGIVARMQRHRRFELLLQAMAMLKERKDLPPMKLMVVGRGTYRQQVAMEPAQRMGLEDMVLFPGYRTDDYLEHLAAMDAKVFLVPGSDGSCRAVREVMALGKPVVATRRGILPELVEDGRTGLLVEETPEALAETLARLAREKGLRKELGEAARRKARETFSIRTQASQVAAFYREILRLGPRG